MTTNTNFSTWAGTAGTPGVESSSRATGEGYRTPEPRPRYDGANLNPDGRMVPENVRRGDGQVQSLGVSDSKVIKRKEEVFLGTWNVRTLNGIGKIELLERELIKYKINIMGIAETKWKGPTCHFKTDVGNLVVMAASDKKQHGVGFMTDKETAKAVIGYESKHNRIISLRIAAKPINMTLVQVYFPTSDHPDEEVDALYDDIEEVMRKYRQDKVYILGDFNAKVGAGQKSAENGVHGLGERNDRGERLVQFCRENELVVGNTLFNHHPRRLYTWVAPNGETKNQIDYFLVQKRWKSTLKNVKTVPGAVFDTDHNLLCSKLRNKLKNLPKGKQVKKINVEALKNEATKIKYAVEIKNRFEVLMQDTSVQDGDSLWNKAKNAMKETGEITLGKVKKKTKGKDWISKQTLLLVEKKRKVKQLRNLSEDMENEFRMLKRDVQRAVRKDKEKWIAELCKEVEQLDRCKNAQGVYRTIKKITGKQRMCQQNIKDEEGNIITEGQAVLNRIREYTENLYRKPVNETEGNRIDLSDGEQEPNVLIDEVRKAIKQLKNGKAAGVDEIPGELIKASGEAGVKLFHKLCNMIWMDRKWPLDWTRGIFVPIPKTGDLQDCKNYRNISLLSHASKVLLNIILNRLLTFSERELPNEQGGFRTGRGTRDMLVILQQLIEKARNMQGCAIYLLFIDYTKAFDMVSHPRLFKVLQEMGIPSHLVALIQALYSQQEAAVKWNNELTEWFPIGKGTRQGCNLSPVEFNLYAEDIMRRTLENDDGGIAVGGRRISNIRYADDTTLVAGSEEDSRRLFRKLVEESERFNMKVNGKKTKAMVVSREDKEVHIALNGEEVEQVEAFKFLGSYKTANGDCTKEIKRRIGMAREKGAQLDNIWKDKNIHKNLKIRLMKALVWSIFLYGAESWTLKKSDYNRIAAFEMWCWRRIAGVTWRDHRTNDSVLQEIGVERELLGRVVRLKLAYFGHVARGSAGELALTVMDGDIEGRRHRGAPRKQWRDNITEWTGCTYQQCKRQAQDRRRWRSMVWMWSSSVVEPRRRMT